MVHSNPAEIEAKWQNYWEEKQTFHTDVWDFSKPKYYVLDMFPYPSGVGLHAGHPEGYTATDIMSRMKRMQGYNVLHPMGYDSFGLPAEQYAVSTGNHPNGFTQENIKTFSKQLKELGFDYDWSKMTATSDPEFYKWTQWIFKKLWEAGYAKRIEMPVNWCEELGTVLSNDEVIDGKSERGGYPVVKKNMMQWVIDQPAFAEKLLEGLNDIDWPESTKEIQRNWIGKSTGVEVDFQLVGGGEFSIYTTCIETIYGITFAGSGWQDHGQPAGSGGESGRGPGLHKRDREKVRYGPHGSQQGQDRLPPEGCVCHQPGQRQRGAGVHRRFCAG